MITEPERYLMRDSYAGIGSAYWGLSPNRVDYDGGASVRRVTAAGAASGNFVDGSFGARPAVSLRRDATETCEMEFFCFFL